MRLLRRAGLVVPLVSLACAEDLPLAEHITEVRPLALRVEVVGDEARAEALPFERVRVVPFIVDPEAPLEPEAIETRLEPRWIACPLLPVVPLGGCLRQDPPLVAADLPACSSVEMPDLGDDPSALQSSGPCILDQGTPARPEYTIPVDPVFLFGGDVELTLVAHQPGAGSTETCLDALLDPPAEIPETCIFATQRVSVGPERTLLDAAAALGLDIAPEVLPPVTEPDRHPRIESFVVEVFEGEEAVASPLSTLPGELVEVSPGQRLELRTEASVDDLQTYPIPRNDGFSEEQEAYTGLWYRSWGDLLSGSSNDPVSLNAWRMTPAEGDEGAAPDGEVATLYYVLRDRRQGVDWWWIRAALAP